VAIGMLAHFGTMLVRFLRRRAEDTGTQTAAVDSMPLEEIKNGRRRREAKQVESGNWFHGFAPWFPVLTTILFGAFIARLAQLPESAPIEMPIYEFGKLPLVYEGRVKPYDTLARNTLQVISGSQQVAVLDEKGKVTSHLPAIRWLLDVVSDAKGAKDYR